MARSEAWIKARSASLFLSVVTVSEVRSGAAKARRTGATRKAKGLDDWWSVVEHLYGDRILQFDLRTARVAAEIVDAVRAKGIAPSFADIIIGATAQARGFVVLTRNLCHFKQIVDLVINPFETLPP